MIFSSAELLWFAFFFLNNSLDIISFFPISGHFVEGVSRVKAASLMGSALFCLGSLM